MLDVTRRSLAAGPGRFSLTDVDDRAYPTLQTKGVRCLNQGPLSVLTNRSTLLGGKVYGQWPGLAPDKEYGPGDLAVTTDFRDVLAEIVQKRLLNNQLAAVFPGYTPRFSGLVAPA
jgi:hypothetical protein